MNSGVNDSTHWRAFDNNRVSHSAAHYLMAIDALRGELGYARSTDVAARLEVSRGAASMALAHLKKRNWVSEDRNRFLLLTDEGRAVVQHVEHNFEVLSRLFEEVLCVSPETARAEACKMEHLMGSETGQRLVLVMRYILNDPSRTKDIHALMRCGTDECESAGYCPLCDGTSSGAAPAADCPNQPAARKKSPRRVSRKQ